MTPPSRVGSIGGWTCATGDQSATGAASAPGRRPRMRSYAWRELTRNPRRTIVSMAGVALGVGLFSGLLFFIDGSGATMTTHALAPLSLDMQRVLTAPLASGLRLEERVAPASRVRAG